MWYMRTSENFLVKGLGNVLFATLASPSPSPSSFALNADLWFSELQQPFCDQEATDRGMKPTLWEWWRRRLGKAWGLNYKLLLGIFFKSWEMIFFFFKPLLTRFSVTSSYTNPNGYMFSSLCILAVSAWRSHPLYWFHSWEPYITSPIPLSRGKILDSCRMFSFLPWCFSSPAKHHCSCLMWFGFPDPTGHSFSTCTLLHPFSVQWADPWVELEEWTLLPTLSLACFSARIASDPIALGEPHLSQAPDPFPCALHRQFVLL